jgi:hypothetical protein
MANATDEECLVTHDAVPGVADWDTAARERVTRFFKILLEWDQRETQRIVGARGSRGVVEISSTRVRPRLTSVSQLGHTD